ncbi:NAD(P)H-hydrate epimerase, partial [Paracoccus nototheniae]
MAMLKGTEIVTAAQMRAMESAAMASGAVTGLALMTRAGKAVAGQIRLRWPRPGRVAVLCGPGANGGDGYVVARLLAQAGWAVRVLGDAPRPGSDAATARAQWQGAVQPLTLAALQGGPVPHLCVDAIFGTGLTRPTDGEIAALLRHLGEQRRCPVVAVDAPSGLCLDSGTLLGQPRGALPPGALRAALTVGFDSPKPGHLLEMGPMICGTLVIADIGLAPWRGVAASALTALWPSFGAAVPSGGKWLRKEAQAQGHKFTHGAALIVAGGPAAGGAARLAARAALR